MARKRISKTEYCVTWQAQGFKNKDSSLAKGIEIARQLGKLRQDIWQKYGSLQAWGNKSDKLIKEFKQTNPPSLYGVAYKPWERTFQSVIDDLHAVQEAAKSFVIRKIYRHFSQEGFRDELVKSLDSQEFLQYPLIKRWVRQEYHRGHTWVNNQIVLDGSDCNIVRSGTVVSITFPGTPIGNSTPPAPRFLPIRGQAPFEGKPRRKDGASRRYEPITLKFQCGRVKPTGRLRIIFENNTVRLCYPKVLTKQPNSNTSAVGLDKGYTEGFYGSDNRVYADGIGKIMTDATDKRHIKGKRRQKLWALNLKLHNSQIKRCNLKTKNQNKFNTKIRATLRTLIRTGVHQVLAHHKQIVCEDLSRPIRSKRNSKKINRRLSAWCKGELQQSIDQVSQRRQSVVTLVNPAYTSQVDSRNGTLLGRRDGDRFFTFDGEVLQADSNASMNVKNRLTDTEISRYQKAETVQKILLKRTASFLASMGLTIDDAVTRGWLHSKHLKGKRARKAAT